MSFFANTEAQQPGEKRKLANISDDSINSNQQSVPVKYLAGRAYVAGDYISPAYNPKAIPIKTQTGKGEESTTGYKYFADFALLFCMGGGGRSMPFTPSLSIRTSSGPATFSAATRKLGK
jgi:hypothetical protein